MLSKRIYHILKNNIVNNERKLYLRAVMMMWAFESCTGESALLKGPDGPRERIILTSKNVDIPGN